MAIIENNFPKSFTLIDGATVAMGAANAAAVNADNANSNIDAASETNATMQLLKQIARDQKISDTHLKNIRVSNMDLTGIYFDGCILEQCKFIDCIMPKGSFVNTRIKLCDFSNSNISDGYFSNCHIDNSKFMGTIITGGILKYVTIDESYFGYSNFDNTRMNNIDINICDFSNSDLNECRLKFIRLHQTNFTMCGLFKTNLYDIDLSSCTIDGIRVSNTFGELRGASVNLYQAAELAKLMGIKIK